MSNLLMVGVAGFAASMVDGALGMGFGPTSSTILYGSGLSPVTASATVNIAKTAAGLVAGVSHWRFGNIDRRLVLRLAVPGCVGALVGATLLKNVDGNAIRPWLAVLLLLVGLRIMFRFRKPLPKSSSAGAEGQRTTDDLDLRGTEVAGAVGGVTNALIAAWGPVATPFLLHRRVSPRVTVGSVNTAEVAVAAVAAASLTSQGLDGGVVLAMLIGGVLAAPLAAWVVRFLPPRGMGIAVAALLLFTNVRELVKWFGIGEVRWAFYVLVLALAATAAAAPLVRRTTLPASS